MRQLALIGLALLAGCAQASTMSANRDEVVIQHDPAFAGAPDLQAKADAECARYGKKAHFIGHEFPNPLWYRYARFACR